MPWSSTFDDPVGLPDGTQAVTLEDAARFIQSLPGAEQHRPHWQTAVAVLIDAAEGRDFLMHARIALIRALNHGTPPPTLPTSRKPAKRFRIVR